MNNISNFSVNHLINEKHFAKSIARCSKFKRYILDLNSEQFSYRYADFPKRLKRRKRKWKKRFKVKKKLLSRKRFFFNKEIFSYFMRRKRDLKFLFLKNKAKQTKPKYKNILYNVRHLKSKGLITKPVRNGFKVFSNKVKGFIHKKTLTRIIKKFKIILLKNSQKLTNSIYLSNLHDLKKFIFHKLTLIRKNDNYGNFRFFANKYNRKKRRRILKLKNKIELEHEKKINTEKRTKKNNKQKYVKKKNYIKH